MTTQTLGDAYMPNDDASYEGAQSSSLWSMDYYRGKAREFQVSMIALDEARNAVLDAVNSGVDENTMAYLNQWLGEFDAKRWQIRAIAEGMNLAASVINSAGGRLPVLSVPQSLAAIPALIPAAGIAAFAAAASMIAWAQIHVNGARERLTMALDAQTTPEGRAALARSVAQVEAANSTIMGNPLGALAPLLKWGAVAVGVYMAWKLLAPRD